MPSKVLWRREDIRAALSNRYYNLCTQQLIAEDRDTPFEEVSIWVHYRQSLLSTAVCCFNLTVEEVEQESRYIVERLHRTP